MSELYAMTLIVVCLAFTSTEIISEQIMLDFFESWGFYTYLYRYVLTYSKSLNNMIIIIFKKKTCCATAQSHTQ